MKGLAFLRSIECMLIAPLIIQGAILEPRSKRVEARVGDKMELVCVRKAFLHKPFVWSRKLSDQTDFVVIETSLVDGEKHKHHHQQQQQQHVPQHKKQPKQPKQQKNPRDDNDLTADQLHLRHQQKLGKHKTTSLQQQEQEDIHQQHGQQQQQQTDRQAKRKLNRTATQDQQKQHQAQTDSNKTENKNTENIKKSQDKLFKQQQQKPERQKQDKRQHKHKNETTATQLDNDLEQQRPPNSNSSTTKQRHQNKSAAAKATTAGSIHFGDNHTSSDGFYVLMATDATTIKSSLHKDRLDIDDSGQYQCMGDGLPSDFVVVVVTRNVAIEYKNATIDNKCPEHSKPTCRRIPPSSSSSSSSSPPSSSSSSAADVAVEVPHSPTSTPSSSSSSSYSSSSSSSSLTPSGNKRSKQPFNDPGKPPPQSSSSSSSPPPSSSLSSFSNSSMVVWTRFNDSSIIQENETLQLEKPSVEDAGEYKCHTSSEDGEEEWVTVHYFAPPSAKIHATKSAKAVEGRDLTLRCQVWGWPLPDVTWLKEGKKMELDIKNKNTDKNDINNSDNNWKVHGYNTNNDHGNITVSINVTSNNNNNSSAPLDVRIVTWREEALTRKKVKAVSGFVSILEITGVQFSDRANYTCIASSLIPLQCYNNTLLTSSSSVMVRISGRLDFLWPLVGIVVEFTVLFIIIVVYENEKKKKKERSREEEDDDVEHRGAMAKPQNRRNKIGKSSKAHQDQQLPMNRLRLP